MSKILQFSETDKTKVGLNRKQSTGTAHQQIFSRLLFCFENIVVVIWLLIYSVIINIPVNRFVSYLPTFVSNLPSNLYSAASTGLSSGASSQRSQLVGENLADLWVNFLLAEASTSGASSVSVSNAGNGIVDVEKSTLSSGSDLLPGSGSNVLPATTVIVQASTTEEISFAAAIKSTSLDTNAIAPQVVAYPYGFPPPMFISGIDR